MAESANGRVLVIPCSGIGKVHGLMAREATYRVVDDLEPQAPETLCLALLVKGDEEAVTAVRTRPCITIDGCPKLCSYKNVELAGGNIAESVRVVDAFKGHKGAQPGTATELDHDGWTITEEIAQRVAARVCELCAGEGK
ncbi:MAG TPA: putative zinc-binding protein [Armatimonadota bacterium]|nr:putative zinc-binding protein [Armatimonadota bacterium]